MKYSIAALSAVLSISAATRLKGTGTRNPNVNVNTEDAAYAEQVEDIFTYAIEEETKDDGDGVVNPLVVGGSNTGKTEYPFMAFAGTCGASLIASNVILTSARCDDITEVNIGRWKLNDNSEVYETFNIIQKVAHPNFDPTTYDNDFMVAQLDGHSTATPVEIDDGTQVVPKNTKIVIMGWGTNQEDGTDGVNKLKDTTIKKKEKKKCKEVYGNSQVTSNNFCAKKGGKGVCTDSRDIGGPAIMKDTKVQVGIISFSKEGACTDQPVMLSKLSAKYSWIKEQVEAMAGTPAPVSPTPAPVTPAPVTPAPVTPAPVTDEPSGEPSLPPVGGVTPAPVTPAPVPSPSDGPSLAPTTRAQVVIPVAISKLNSAVDIIEDEL